MFWGFENDDIFRSHGIMWVAHRNLWRAPTPKVRMTLPTLKHPHANILIREPMAGTCWWDLPMKTTIFFIPRQYSVTVRGRKCRLTRLLYTPITHHHTFYKSGSGHHTELVKTPLHRKEGPVPTSILIRGISKPKIFIIMYKVMD